VRGGLVRAAALAAALALASCGASKVVGESAGDDGGVNVPTPPPPTTSAATLEGAAQRCETSRLAPPFLRRLTRLELENTLRDVFPSLGASWSGVDLGPDPLSPLGFANDALTLQVDGETARELLNTAKDVASLVTDAAHLPGVLACAAKTPDEACAVKFIDDVGTRLYRRPFTADERAELIDRFRSVSGRAGFAPGLKWTLVAMLQSPAFLYRSELGDAAGHLSQYELATELAYTYGGSTPSRELLDAAARGELSAPGALARQAAALLATPRGQAAFTEFFREWSGYQQVLGMDKAGVGGFTKEIAPLLAEETRRFLSGVVDAGGGVKELLTQQTTYLNDELAGFYGYGAGVTDFAPVARPEGRGIGLLAQASILARRAHYDFTSPTFRGLFVSTRLLCRAPAARPAGVHPVQDTPQATTTRQRYEMQHEQGDCAPCHKSFEPFGYGLEHFGATGVFRPDEDGHPIDAHASIELADGTMVEFDGLEDLARKLAALPEVTDCVGGLLTSYVFAGGGGETCLAEDARSRLGAGQLGLRDFYLALASAPSFANRAR
jgi:hypothetical protein